jgi:hypothetical protein
VYLGYIQQLIHFHVSSFNPSSIVNSTLYIAKLCFARPYIQYVGQSLMDTTKNILFHTNVFLEMDRFRTKFYSAVLDATISIEKTRRFFKMLS